ATQDHDEFTVTVHAQKNGDSDALGTVNIVPIAAIPAETRFIDNDRPVPKLPIYNDIRVSPSAEKRWFNGVERTTRDVAASGFEVRFDPADKHAELNRFSGAVDIGRIAIEADSVIIRGALRLPQTEVRISARRLIFEDATPDSRAQIDTTPLAWPKPAGDGNSRNVPSDGSVGLPAGDVHLVLDQLVAGGGIRFVMNGGRGQDPEPGRRGDDGKSVRSWTEEISKKETYTNVVYVQNHRVQNSSSVPTFREPDLRPNDDYTSYKHQPTDGENGASAGRPGDGGPGGTLRTSNPAWRAHAQQEGGEPGLAPGPYDGGAAGRPTRWKKIRKKTVTTFSSNSQPLTTVWFVAKKEGRTRAGEGSGPVPVGNAGAPGLVQKIDDEKITWLTTSLLRLVVERLRDVYLAGRIDQAMALVGEFGPLTADLVPNSVDERRELIVLRRELGTLTHRLAAGLDYFGNPPGWVPNLSVEVNYSAFQQEIDSAIRMLYSSYWLNRHWRALEEKTEALDRLITLQHDQIESHRRRYTNASSLLPVLEAEQRRIDADAAFFLEKLRARERELAQNATDRRKGRRSDPGAGNDNGRDQRRLDRGRCADPGPRRLGRRPARPGGPCDSRDQREGARTPDTVSILSCEGL
ncbi:MAG: flagellar export protein FliJ, partial [Sedimenticolaceae bacterium]